MTATRSTTSLAVAGIDEAATALRQRGMRVSTSRRVVLEALFASDRPVSAEEISSGLGGYPPVDLTSVYRNLETLEEVGLVRHLHLGHGPGLYVLTSVGDAGYLVCDSCGDVSHLPSAGIEQIRRAIRAASGYEPRFTHFPLTGLCPVCRAENEGDVP
jgi:Fur family ferric uptake transcriptional regulator